jgi:exoribonuclease-2
MDKGTLVEFRLQGDRRLGVVDRSEGKKWVVVDDRGQSHTLPQRNITYEVTGQAYTVNQIPSFLADVEPYLDPSSLEVAWELLSEEGEAVNPAEMAQLLFSDRSPALQYAAHHLLSEDKLYFKQKGDRYEPRSANQVSELKHQFMMAAQRAQEREGFSQRLAQALKGEPVEWQKSDRPRIDAIERLATFGEDAINTGSALEILSGLGYAEDADAAFKLLVDLKFWESHENLFLRRNQTPNQFPQKVIEMAQSRLQSPPPDADPDRLDLTHLKTYTIDDEETREIDDGLSLEVMETGLHRIWVHIADPTRWLLMGDEIDLEARRRCTTVYLPTGMIPMFPAELATGPMSLIQGEVCPALSFGVILDETGEVMDFMITPSLVRPTYRLTYEDVDEMIELGIQAESDLQAIAHWATVRQQWRTAQGAIQIRMPESSIKVQNDEITIQVLDDSKARQLVAEMMILAGEVAGRYGQEHNIPLPFRGQPQPELPSDEELMQLPAGLVRECAVRRCMPRSETSTTPVRHASLGLDTYTQVTSPIRRYTDLIAHFQIKAHLRGDRPPIPLESLEELLLTVNSTAYESILVERQTNRYWGLEYLRRFQDHAWSAMLLRWLREHDNLGLIFIEDLGLELAMRFKRNMELGERFEVKVSHVDPRKDTIQFVELVVDPATATA